MPRAGRRTEVVDAAARLFAERGYHATSIEDLLAATGLTRGGLYHYISSKADLLIEVQRELLDPLLERAREVAAGGGDAEAQLREITRLWVEHVEGHRHHMVVFEAERRTVESDPRWAEIVAARNEFEALLDEVLRRGERTGGFVFDDRGLVLLALLGMVNHLPSWYRPEGRLSAREVADRFVDLILGGIRAERR